MKTVLPFKIFLLVLVLPLLVFANTDIKGKYSKEKTIHKEYTVNADATLKIKNSYGHIDVTTWNENKIVIDVTITTNGDNEENVQKKLDEINVTFSNSADLVSAETTFNKGKKKSWWNSWKKNNVNMKINYVVKMPISNNVNLNNNYGYINLDKLEGQAIINCDYGKITTKELLADDNTINFDYTKDSYFEYIKSGKINADYSEYTVSKTNNLDISADYTKNTIEIAEDINYNCDYGSLNIENINNIKGNGDYLTVRIGNVYKNLFVKADYGALKIDNMSANAGNIAVDSDYMKITIGYDTSYHFNFNLDLNYASLHGKENLNFNKEIKKSHAKYYQGFYGKSNSNNTINIKSNYGSVSLNKN